eukprot:scaffold130192_cov15-Tisochrysis_lutea.AAC.1
MASPLDHNTSTSGLMTLETLSLTMKIPLYPDSQVSQSASPSLMRTLWPRPCGMLSTPPFSIQMPLLLS